LFQHPPLVGELSPSIVQFARVLLRLLLQRGFPAKIFPKRPRYQPILAIERTNGMAIKTSTFTDLALARQLLNTNKPPNTKM
jgi:hypothetical protein